jgi:hypothetical protein
METCRLKGFANYSFIGSRLKSKRRPFDLRHAESW